MDSEPALGALKQSIKEAIESHTNRLKQLASYKDECMQTHKLLDELPTKLKHNVMVPFGKVAFFPGHLIHTNEVLVDIGAKHHVECTAQHAQGILQRRIEHLEADMSKLEKEIKDAEEQYKVSDLLLQTEGGEGLSEIRQTLEESENLLQQAPKAGTSRAPPRSAKADATDDEEHERLMRRLEELALLEEAEEQQEMKNPAGSTGRAAAQPTQQQASNDDEEQEVFSEEDHEDSDAAAADFDLSSAFEAPSFDDIIEHPLTSTTSENTASKPVAPAPAAKPKRVSWADDVAPPSEPPAASASASHITKAPAKPSAGIRKGFFGAPAKRQTAAAPATATSTMQQRITTQATTTAAAPSPASRAEAFTGAVLEHPVEELHAAAGQQQSVAGQQSSAMPSTAAASSSEGAAAPAKRMSKFKMQRMGLLE